MLGDDSDSDSDNYSSNNRRKRVSEEDSLLTRRVYDPNHVYAHTPSEHTSRPSQWGAGPPHPLQQSPPRIHHNLPQEQPPQSFDYGHGFPLSIFSFSTCFCLSLSSFFRSSLSHAGITRLLAAQSSSPCVYRSGAAEGWLGYSEGKV